ncbi:MAG: helix-turn-helix domain-containing protein [Oscillospiraceae bacterium]|nr:helix-turn-helix domain-containing protein [Oscillospiraceae bacterium]
MDADKLTNCNRNNASRAYQSLLPYDVMEAAIAGDEDAMCEVVNNYANYIRQFVQEDCYDRDGYNYRGSNKLKSDIMKVNLMRSFQSFKYDPNRK